jgi:ribosomal protein L27
MKLAGSGACRNPLCGFDGSSRAGDDSYHKILGAGTFTRKAVGGGGILAV